MRRRTAHHYEYDQREYRVSTTSQACGASTRVETSHNGAYKSCRACDRSATARSDTVYESNGRPDGHLGLRYKAIRHTFNKGGAKSGILRVPVRGAARTRCTVTRWT